MSSRSRVTRAKTTTFPYRRSKVRFRWCPLESVLPQTELAHRCPCNSASALDGDRPEGGRDRGKLRERTWPLARVCCEPRGSRSAVDQPRHLGRISVCFARNRCSARLSSRSLRVSGKAPVTRGGDTRRRAAAVGWCDPLSLSICRQRAPCARG